MAWPWDWFNAAGDVLAATLALPWTIASILMEIAMAVIYPAVLALNLLLIVVNEMVFPFALFVNNMIGFGNSFHTLIAVFDGTFPSEWLILMGMIISINIYLRIYGMVPLIGRK